MNPPTSDERDSWFWQPFDYRLPIAICYGVLWILILIELGCPSVAAQTEETYTFTIGHLTQTSTEREECYATIGFNPKEGFLVAAPPAAEVCHRLRELADRKVKGRLVFEVEK